METQRKPECPTDPKHEVRWAMWFDEFYCTVCNCTIKTPKLSVVSERVAEPPKSEEK